VSGVIPPLADPYFQRLETGIDLKSALVPGETVVLTHGEQAGTAPAAQGGTGKTQLAVEFTQALRSARAVDALIWVTATSREAVITGFAQAAAATGVGSPDSGAVEAAARFAAWLARTERRWALVLDDLADLADLEGLWPAGLGGQVVITTRLPGAAFTAGVHPAAAAGLRIVPLGGFSRREGLSYLSSRLTDYSEQRIEALDLAEDLDGLPLGLAQATAVMNITRMSCQDYRAQFGERRRYMSGQPVEGVSAAILATWSLAVECAHQLTPPGLAWPALALSAMLDPHGIPGAVLTSPAAYGYVTGQPSTAPGADANVAQAAVTNLARVGLVTIDPANPVRTVWMHPSVQAAVRAYLPSADTDQVVVVPAGARQGAQQMDQALRDCAISLGLAGGRARGASGPAVSEEADVVAGADMAAGAGGARGADALPALDALWQPEAHPLLFRLGRSLEDSGLGDAAMTYWQSMVTASSRRLGSTHPSALVAKDRLGVAYETASRVGDAIAVFASTLGDWERSYGPEHPDTITARGRLAHAYVTAGLPAEAVAIYEHMVADSGRQLGLGHPVTLTARVDLAAAYSEAGWTRQALTAYQMLSVDADRLLGSRHPTTLAVRDSLASALLASGQSAQAVELYKGLVADCEAATGPDHPDTIAARASLASAFRRSGKPKDAIAQYKRVLADRERTAGPDHPDTIAARANLAFAYRSAGQLREAIPGYERTLADRERVQGPDHADTRLARSNLAAACQQAGRLAEAIQQYERAVADCERLLGPGDSETLTARASLASALFAVGRLVDVTSVLQRALADSERHLGPDHPMTQALRGNLAEATRT